MLEIRTGDLLKEAVGPRLIAHGCNAQGKMGSGFAKKLTLLYPENYLYYQRAHRSDHPLVLGEVLFCSFGDTAIANIISQRYYGRDPSVVYADYDAIRKGLLATKKYINVHRLPIHLPLIGGGLANGNRDKLIDIFEQTLKGVEATLWLPKPNSRFTDTFDVRHFDHELQSGSRHGDTKVRY